MQENVARNPTFVQKETSTFVTWKVNLTLIVDVNFILMCM